MKFWLLGLVEMVTHTLGGIPGVCFKAVKVASVFLLAPVQRQEGKIKTTHFDNGNTNKFIYSGEKKKKN